MSRFFRTTPEVYTAARAGLDAVFGHPKTAAAPDGTEVITLTCLPPVEEAPSDEEWNVLVAIHERDWSMPEVASLIADLLAGGHIIEITQAEYIAAIPQEDGK